MAFLRKKKAKAGYELGVNEKCIFATRATIQTYKQNYSEANTLRDQVNQRIRKVKTGEINVGGWMRKEKIEWLRSGNQPERLQNEVLTLFSTIDKYLLDLIEGNTANSTVVSYKDHLKRANHYFKDDLPPGKVPVFRLVLG